MTPAGTATCPGCAALTQVIEQRRAEVAQLRAELDATRAKLAAAKKNSRNSSKPPSSDIVKKPKAPPPDGGQRKQGGQPGHPLHELKVTVGGQVMFDRGGTLPASDGAESAPFEFSR